MALVAGMSNADVAGARWQRMNAPYFGSLEMAGRGRWRHMKNSHPSEYAIAPYVRH